MTISPERLNAHTRKLADDIGPRTMGSLEDQAAIDYIVDQLEACGCEVGYHEIICPCWQHRSTSLELVATGESIPAQGCQFSVACDVTGEVVHATTPDALNNAPVAGKICLAPTGVLGGNIGLLNIMALALEARGAAGLIVDRDHRHPDAYDGKIVREPDLRRMPVACVSKRGARRILASQSPVRLQIDASFWHGHTHTVVCPIEGSGPGRIFLAAHHDTGAGSPGAVDDGSSVAILLELARLFSEETPPCELRFLFTGAHERLGQGSKDYVRDNPDLIQSSSCELNFDGVGDLGGSPTVNVWGRVGFDARLEPVLRDGPWQIRSVEADRMGADAGAFTMAGLPSVYFQTPPQEGNLFHTQLDDMSSVNLDLVTQCAETTADVIRSGFWRD